MTLPSRLQRCFPAALITLLMGPALAASTPDSSVPSVWQHRHEKIGFHGFRTQFQCDALEGEIRRILVFLGARADAKVNADCPRGPFVPDENAWIEADFYTLAPAGVATSGAGPTIEGRWVQTTLEPHHPIFMEEGDCFLIENLKPLITHGFVMRDITRYTTDCEPREDILNSYDVEAVVLRPPGPTVTKPELGNH